MDGEYEHNFSIPKFIRLLLVSLYSGRQKRTGFCGRRGEHQIYRASETGDNSACICTPLMPYCFVRVCLQAIKEAQRKAQREEQLKVSALLLDWVHSIILGYMILAVTSG